jgi:hypothetical protein
VRSASGGATIEQPQKIDRSIFRKRMSLAAKKVMESNSMKTPGFIMLERLKDKAGKNLAKQQIMSKSRLYSHVI